MCWRIVELLPVQHEIRLFVERDFGVGVGVNKEVSFCFEVGKELMIQPFPMVFWYISELANCRIGRAIGLKRFITTNIQSLCQMVFVGSSIQHHDVMVAT